MYSALTVLVFASVALASPFSQQQLSNNAAQQQTLSRPWASALPHRESKLLNVTPESAKFAKVSSDDVESDAVYARKSIHYPARFSNPCPSLQQQSGWGAGQQQAVACDSVESDAVYARKSMDYPARFSNPCPSLQQQSGWGTGQQQAVACDCTAQQQNVGGTAQQQTTACPHRIHGIPRFSKRELFVTRPGVENLNIGRMTPGKIERIRADAMQEQMGGGFAQQQLIPEFPRKSLLEKGEHELFVTRPGIEKLKLGRMTPGKIERIRVE